MILCIHVLYFVNQVTFFSLTSSFWYKILDIKNREVCKVRKRLICTINEDFYMHLYIIIKE